MATFLLQKYSHDQNYLVEEIHRIFHSLPVKSVGNLTTAIFVYYLEFVEDKRVLKQAAKKLSTELKEDIMTAYEAIKKEGIEVGLEKGREKGRIHTIVEGYKRNIAIDLLAQITHSSVQQVRKILKEQGFTL